MFKTMLETGGIFYLMGAAACAGVFGKVIAGMTLGRLVREAGNMSQSEHKLMRLVRAKFEHACMVSDKVRNVNAFVEKFICEYRVGGLRLHTWSRLAVQSIWLVGALGILGAAVSYSVRGIGEEAFRYAAFGGVGAVLLFLVCQVTDENYKIEVLRIYMVDYLQNVCIHRYEKQVQREMGVQENAEILSGEMNGSGEAKDEAEPMDSVPGQGGNAFSEPDEPKNNTEELMTRMEEDLKKEAMIRDILEEFLA